MTSKDQIDPELLSYSRAEQSQTQNHLPDLDDSSPNLDIPDNPKKSWTWNYGTMIIDRGIKKWKCALCSNPSRAQMYSISSGTGKFARNIL